VTFPEAVRFFIYETTRFLTPEAVATEWVLLALAALIVAAVPAIWSGKSAASSALKRIQYAIYRIGNSKRTAIAICGTLPILIRLSMLGVIPVPEPSIHDEFSHLLLGDTLAHGRLTNPTHPMWQHFESIHIIQRPTYNSMYPPGQGAFLALGEVVFREPWAGVVISVGLMYAAMCWMMQGWLPPAWAFYGTLIAILKFGLFGFWINSYMGGSVAAIGGALLFGSLPRIKGGRARRLPGFLLGLGLVLLMNSRPFEGAVLGSCALLYLLLTSQGKFPGLVQQSKRLLRPVVLPAGLVLLCGILFAGYYSWRVTGNPTRMPYQVNRDTYGWPENLAFLPAKNLTLHHKVLEAMYHQELNNRDRYNAPDKIIDNLATRLFDNWTFFIGPLLTAPLIFLPWIFRDKRTRILVAFLAAMAFMNLFQLVLYPYHLAPVVPIIFAVVAQGIRYIYVNLLRASWRRAVTFAVVLPFSLILVGAMKQEADYLGIPLAYWERAAEPHRDARAYIESWLKARPRQQLVIVRYGPDHPPNQEWVYNRADIDHSKVVWAREMDPCSDERLLRYFSGREPWLLEADVYPQRVVPYPKSKISDECKQPSSERHRFPDRVPGALF